MPRVIDRLFLKNPYDGLIEASQTTDLQGWNSEHPLLSALIALVRPHCIIEVGVWKGGSAIYMADACKREGLLTEIICIDTWLGSPEHVLAQHNPQRESWYSSLRVNHGRPDLYHTFLANVLAEGHSDYITPFPMSSDSAAVVLRTLEVTAQLIHIDGGHEHESVARDIREYWPMLTDDGVLICDDYGTWPGVTKAVNEFAAAAQRPVYAINNKAAIPKGKALKVSVQLNEIAWR